MKLTITLLVRFFELIYGVRRKKRKQIIRNEDQYPVEAFELSNTNQSL
jgi:hypothetical protein